MLDALAKRFGLNITENNFQVRAEQLRTLVQAYPAMIVSNAVMAPLVAWLMWNKVTHGALLTWVALLYVFHALEIRHWLNYPKRINDIRECKRWQRQFLLSDALVGASWGSAGIFMFVPGDPMYQMFLLCIMLGMASAAVAGNLVFPLSQQTYVALVILPILSSLLRQGIHEYYLLAAMVGIFLIFVMKVGRDQSKIFELSILRGFENSQLIHESQRTNEQLHLSDELLRHSQSVAKLGSWRLSQQGSVLQWSDETYRIFGIPPGTPLNYDFFLAQVHPDDREMLEQAWQAAIKNAGHYFVQHRIVVRGETRWIEERAELDFDAQGNFRSGTGSAQDITERKQLEATRQEALDRFQKIAQLVPGAIYQFQLRPDGSTSMPYVSDAFQQIFQLTPEEVSEDASKALARAHPDDLESFMASIRTSAQNLTPWEHEYRIKLDDDTVRWLFGNSLPQREADGSILWHGFITDITERKLADVALQNSERRLSEIMESVDAHIFLKDTQGRFLFANRPVREMFGASLEEIVGQRDERYFDAATCLQIRNNDRPVLEQGATSKKEETLVNLKDGSTSTYLSVKIPLRNAAGEIYALCGISTDISERKLKEELLLNSLQQLEEKELSKTRFLAAAGHDLRQPIAAANLFVDALKHTSPTPRQTELITRLDQSMSIFSGLLERLLDISKFDAGLIKPRISSYDLAELFNWLEQNFAQAAHEQSLRFKFYSPVDTSLIVRTDIGLLQSVLMNLVSNAIKFTAHGGILISARQRGDRVLLQVWDTGIGIPETDIPHIFDEFYQVANPQRSRDAGLGLGLSICQRAMSLLGGKVACRSRFGHGSVFEISLPRNGEQHEIKPLPAISTPPAVYSEAFLKDKLLVVLEDDALVADGMINLLQEMGAKVLLFYNAEEALQHADIGNADYFIVDYALGGEITGLNFLVAVQQRQQTPIRAVVVTGETSSQFISSVTDSPWPVLHKPINFAKLVSSLHAPT